MIILGIDPWTTTIWFALLEKTEKKHTLLEYGVIETTPRQEMSLKLIDMARDLESLITTFQPTIAGIEKLFFLNNLKTGIDVAQARGVILHTLATNGVIIKEYTPLQVKQGITGNGNAKKRQIQNTIKILFNMEEIPKPDDAADAIAIAYLTSLTIR